MGRRRGRSERAVAALIAVAALGTACKKKEPKPGAAANGSAAPPVAPPTTAADASRVSVIDFLESGDACTFGHRGVLVDLGDTSTRARMSGSRLTPPDVEIRERKGASWASVRARSLELSFVSPAELGAETGIVVEARARGGVARSVSVYLNGKPIGALPLRKGETTLPSARAQAVVLKGTNELLLRFNGGPRGTVEPFGEIDWIRVGPQDSEGPYSAPTRNDAITTMTIAGAQRRAVSLRAPGFARCTAFVPNGSVLEGAIGVSGGEAEAEVRVLVDRQEPRVVASFRLGPGDPPGFRPFSVPLGDVGTLAGVELVATSSSKGARVAFADARVTASAAAAPAPPAPQARGVVLVVLGSIARSRVGAHGGGTSMPEVTALARGGLVFDAHRATSTLSHAALASMLTGVTPREHGASDPDAALSPSVFSVAEAARQAGVMTAMFTANPMTTEPFGFGRGWETFVARLPGEEEPATAVFDDAARWLDANKTERFFVVVHARGGHPPWDVTSDELATLPPRDYQGGLEPKHAGEALGKARSAGGRGFADTDRERAFALHARALAAHDTAIGTLAARLRSLGREKDTVWIVTGDIGVNAAARVPFLEDELLQEGALAIPLVIHTPSSSPADERVAAPTSSVDIAPTILEALGLEPPPHLQGESLWKIATRPEGLPERPLVASTTTRLSARWGSFAVIGAGDRETRVCDLALDPDCVSDVRPSHPLAAEALRALAWRETVLRQPGEQGAGSPGARPAQRKRTLVVADGPTSAALRAWGR